MQVRVLWLRQTRYFVSYVEIILFTFCFFQDKFGKWYFVSKLVATFLADVFVSS